MRWAGPGALTAQPLNPERDFNLGFWAWLFGGTGDVSQMPTYLWISEHLPKLSPNLPWRRDGSGRRCPSPAAPGHPSPGCRNPLCLVTCCKADQIISNHCRARFTSICFTWRSNIYKRWWAPWSPCPSWVLEMKSWGAITHIPTSVPQWAPNCTLFAIVNVHISTAPWARPSTGVTHLSFAFLCVSQAGTCRSTR